MFCNNKKKEGGGDPVLDTIQEGILSRLSAFCGGLRGLGTDVYGSELLGGGGLFITCTPRQGHFGGGTKKRDSFQCRMKPMT